MFLCLALCCVLSGSLLCFQFLSLIVLLFVFILLWLFYPIAFNNRLNLMFFDLGNSDSACWCPSLQEEIISEDLMAFPAFCVFDLWFLTCFFSIFWGNLAPTSHLPTSVSPHVLGVLWPDCNTGCDLEIFFLIFKFKSKFFERERVCASWGGGAEGERLSSRLHDQGGALSGPPSHQLDA